MNSILSKIGNGFFEFSKIISNNKYVSVVRDAFAGTISITIISSIFILINNLVVGGDIGILKDMPGHEIISNICIQGYNGTIGILTLAVTILIGANLGKAFGKDGIIEGITALICFVALVPNVVSLVTSTGENVSASAILTNAYMGGGGLFMGLISSLLSVRLLVFLDDHMKLRIKMPDSVPPAIMKSFDSLLPSIIVVVLFSAIEVFVEMGLGIGVLDLLNSIVRAPLMGGFQSFFGIVFYCFLTIFLFAFGIHGPQVLSAVASPILLSALQENMDAVKNGLTPPNIVTSTFVDSFVYITMISLVIAIFIGSRRQDYKMVAKVGMVPAIFNISEPLVFGLPIAFNPILAIPFVICPIVSSSITYIAISLNLVPPACATVPWVTPAIISGYFVTGGDIRGSILQIIIIAVGVCIYLPFVILANRQKVKN